MRSLNTLGYVTDICTEQQGRKCTYNVIMKRFRIAIVAGEKQYVLHILSVCL